MQRLPRLYSLIVVITALFIGPARASDDATFVPVDFPGSVFTTVRDITPSGDIVGRYGTADKRTHGYLRSAAGAFTSIDYPGANLTAAIGINPQGDIVGVIRLQGQAPTSRHSFLLQDGVFTVFDCSGATSTNAAGINARGDIVGSYTAPDNTIHGFLYNNGACTTIDFPGAIETHAFKITSRGVILGAYVAPGATNHDFVLDGDDYRTVELPQAPVPTLDDGGINNRGDITGWFCLTSACAGAGDIFGFLLNDDGFHIVDVPGATCVYGPLAINSRGDMAGAYSVTAACTDTHGFLLTRHGRGPESENGDR